MSLLGHVTGRMVHVYSKHCRVTVLTTWVEVYLRTHGSVIMRLLDSAYESNPEGLDVVVSGVYPKIYIGPGSRADSKA